MWKIYVSAHISESVYQLMEITNIGMGAIHLIHGHVNDWLCLPMSCRIHTSECIDTICNINYEPKSSTTT